MAVRILITPATTFERPTAGRPLVVAPSAEAGASHPEGRVASWKIWLRVDDAHDTLGLGSFDVADERPKKMQGPLDIS